MAERVRVSFCATNLNTVDRLPRSIASVTALGETLGTPFEVVVADGPSTDGARAWLEARARDDPRFKVVPHAEANRGYGRRRAFGASSGTTIVPFDTSLEYAAPYSGLLQAYLALATERMLFSEICALSRRSIEAVGGWRDLVGGEDIDLYTRVIARSGVVAWPTDLRSSQAVRMGALERQMRYVPASGGHRWARIYAVQRDQIIGANYRVRDLMRFNRRRPAGRRFLLRVFFTVAYFGSRTRPIKPVELGQSNYLYFRTALLESMHRKDYQELAWDGPAPRLLLTPDEQDYLAATLPNWGEYVSGQPPLVGTK